MSNLLCVDWDFFFVSPMEAGNTDDPTWQLHDWGHSEHLSFFLDGPLWTSRAGAFLQNGFPLPGVTAPEGGWKAFWDRFTFAEDADFTFGDSNSLAGAVEPPNAPEPFEKVVLFDAHHDSGYHIKSFKEFLAQDRWDCEDWMLEHQERGTRDLTVRYPQWNPKAVENELPKGVLTKQVIDDGLPLDGIVFDTVFVCRSGAWVPPWCDRDFLDFLHACPLDGMQVDDAELDRGFNLDQVKAVAEQMKAAFAGVEALNRARGTD